MPKLIPEVKHVHISAEYHGQRIDNFLFRQLKGVPKSHIYKLLRSGQVRVNKGRKQATYKLQTGDMLRLPPVRLPDNREPHIPPAIQQQLEESVLFENDELFIINKPSGIAVHAGSGVEYGVIEALRASRPDQNIELVHRLDRDTSGCLAISKNRATLNILHDAFRSGASNTVIEKTYLTLVAGKWSEDKTVQTSLSKTTRGGERMMQADENGQTAVSHFTVIKHYADTSLMEVKIDTGRTHQIRVHALLTGHPVAGDSKYGNRQFNSNMKKRGLNRLFLHASKLILELDSIIKTEAPLDQKLQQVLSDYDS